MSKDLSVEFRALHDAWGKAIAEHDYDWFERHFADDFLGTAQPWPTLTVDKRTMIELEKNIEKMEVEWLTVRASRFGQTVLTHGVVKYHKEEFRAGATIGEGMPTGDQLSALVNGKMVLYTGAWRRNGSVWQAFDHHMVGIVDALPE
jgi:hypothetical protein